MSELSTARPQPEEQTGTATGLPNNDDLFKMVFDEAAIGIVLLNTAGEIQASNAAWHAIVGADENAMTDSSFSEWLDPSSQPHFANILAHMTSADVAETPRRAELRVRRPDSEQPLWISLTLSWPLGRSTASGPLIALAEDISERQSTSEELDEVRHRLARSRERAQIRLAQTLHDGPMQDLYAAQYQLQRLRRRLRTGTENDLLTIVDKISETYTQVNETLRAICGELRPPSLTPFGLAAALRSYVEQFQNRYPALTIDLDLPTDDQRLPEYVRLTLFRIVQEALGNIARHALATRALLCLTLDDDEITLEIHDNGAGFEVPQRWIDLARANRFGLLMVAERAEEIDGCLMVLSEPGSGTIVRVTVPLLPIEENTEHGGNAS